MTCEDLCSSGDDVAVLCALVLSRLVSAAHMPSLTQNTSFVALWANPIKGAFNQLNSPQTQWSTYLSE